MKTTMHKFVAVLAGVALFAGPSYASASVSYGTTDWGVSGSTATTTATTTAPAWTDTATLSSGTTGWTTTTSAPAWTNTATMSTGTSNWTASTAPAWTDTATLSSGTTGWTTSTSAPAWTDTATLSTGTTNWNTASTAPAWTDTATLSTGTTNWNTGSTAPAWTDTATLSTGTTNWNTNAPAWTDTATLSTGNSDWKAPVDCQGDAVVNNPTFPDTKGHWGQEYICRSYKLGIVSGYLAGPFQGFFKPDNNVTRAELLKTVMKMQGINLSQTSSKSTFRDVESNAWYTGYVAKAKELGIIEGYKDGTFRPHANVNRAEAVKMILLASGVTKTQISAESSAQVSDSDSFADFPDVNETAWYASYVSLAKSKGILNGKSDGLFHASDTMTRAEMVKVVLLSFDFAN